MTIKATFATDDPELFKSLTKRPAYAIPTILLFLVCTAAILGAWALALTQSLPLWQCGIITSIAMYFMFSPFHDAAHGAVSTNKKVNSFVGFWGLALFAPISSREILKTVHLRHHAFSNDPIKDPDKFAVTVFLGPLWAWFFMDIIYLVHYIIIPNKRPKDIITSLIHASFGVVAIIALGYNFPMELFMLWFIPSRIAHWLIILVFVYLPHQPHTHLGKEEPYKATLIRDGWDWLLTPLMAYQNWHLIHHLYPTVPFYRYKKVWNAKRAFHESNHPARVSAFQLKPNEDTVSSSATT